MDTSLALIRRKLVAAAVPLLAAPLLFAQQRVEFGPPRAPSDDTPLPLSEGLPPRQLAEGAEVYVISGYEGEAPRTLVRVDRPGKRVLLVLTSYDKIFWHVEPTPTTVVAGILLSNYDKSSAVKAQPGTPAFRVALPYAYEADNSRFRTLLARLQEWLGVQALSGIRGAYTLPSAIDIRQPDAPRAELTVRGVQPQAPRRNFGFTLLTHDLRPVDWTLTGSEGERLRYAEGGRVAVSADGARVWRLMGDGVEAIDAKTGILRKLVLPPDFPSFSWAMDLAHDPVLNVLTVVTLGGEGFLYRYDTAGERWLDVRSLKDIDIASLAFDPVASRYAAWTTAGALLLISRHGEAILHRRIIEVLPAFGTMYDRGNEQPPRLTLAPRGDDIAMVAFRQGRVSHIWVYNVQRHQAQFTWRAAE